MKKCIKKFCFKKVFIDKFSLPGNFAYYSQNEVKHSTCLEHTKNVDILKERWINIFGSIEDINFKDETINKKSKDYIFKAQIFSGGFYFPD